jgi:signal transduction histidine kinase
MRIRVTRARRLIGLEPLLVDVAIAVLLAITVCVAGAEYHPSGWPRFDITAYALSCLACLPLAARRRRPTVVLVVSCTASAAYLAAGNLPSVNVWGPLIALYTVAAHRPLRIATAGAALAGVIVLYGGLIALPAGLAVAEAVLVTGVVYLFGTASRRLGERNAQLADLTTQLHEEQEERAQQAVTGERVRIARELHDVVAHHMSVVSVQAGLARYVLVSDPATAGNALDTIASTSTEALEEMRRLLAVLRIPPQAVAYSPAPGLARLEELVERVRNAGVPVEVSISGRPYPLAPGVDQCVYRVIQESLTNVLKHAAQASATVTVRYGTEHVIVHITDDGQGTPPADKMTHGLIGMAERARLYGGTVVAGPRPQGGFEVVLTLPAPIPPAVHPQGDGRIPR